MENIKLCHTPLGDFYVLTNDRWIGKTLLSGNAWEEPLIRFLEKYVKEGSTVLDIGANIGTHSVPFAKYVGVNGTVYSFEPQQKIYNLLVKNIRENKLTNIIIPLNKAVGHRVCKVRLNSKVCDGINKGKKLNYNTDELTNYGGIELGNDGEEIEMINIDSLELDNISLIKIDVEGCEQLAICGLKKTIARCKPVIVYEEKKSIPVELLNSMDLGKAKNFDIKKFLAKQGYKNITKIKNDTVWISTVRSKVK